MSIGALTPFKPSPGNFRGYMVQPVGSSVGDTVESAVASVGFGRAQSNLEFSFPMALVGPLPTGAGGFTLSNPNPHVGTIIAIIPGPTSATFITYQWRNFTTNTDIVGQTGPTYTCVLGDIGSAISCILTLHNAYGIVNTATDASNPVLS